jgi:hypothetical protein
LEVLNSASVWGTVCDDNFNLYAAGLMCVELGYSASNAYFENGPLNYGLPILLDDVYCGGTEASIWHCSMNVYDHDCAVSENVYLSCSIDNELTEVSELSASASVVIQLVDLKSSLEQLAEVLAAIVEWPVSRLNISVSDTVANVVQLKVTFHESERGFAPSVAVQRVSDWLNSQASWLQQMNVTHSSVFTVPAIDFCGEYSSLSACLNVDSCEWCAAYETCASTELSNQLICSDSWSTCETTPIQLNRDLCESTTYHTSCTCNLENCRCMRQGLKGGALFASVVLPFLIMPFFIGYGYRHMLALVVYFRKKSIVIDPAEYAIAPTLAVQPAAAVNAIVNANANANANAIPVVRQVAGEPYLHPNPPVYDAKHPMQNVQPENPDLEFVDFTDPAFQIADLFTTHS